MTTPEAQYDDEWEDDTGADFYDGFDAPQNPLLTQSSMRSEYDDGQHDEEPVVMSSRVDGPRDMWGQEIIALVRNTVETTRRALQNSLASSGLTEDAASQTKLTIQLKSQGLREFPTEAVELLKPDVERLVLAHNSIPHIPYKFSELQGLTFLNVRANRMREFPKAFLKLSRLQMLDISRNELLKIPDEVDQMKGLKVLSASGNRLETIPNSVGSLQALKILKIDNNPLNIPLKKIISAAGGFGAGTSHPPQQTEHELNLTIKIKEFLRTEMSSQESGDSSEGPLETPRPLRRNNSLRFPVAVPGLSSSESTPDLTSPRFFGSGKPHQRVVSNAGASGSLRRTGVTTLLMNDRNRSNSEGVLQSSQNAAPKRLALPLKQAQELSESQANRNSLHLRGVSHGSALNDRPPSGRPAARHHAANGANGYGPTATPEAHQIKRLSSLPEAELPDIPGHPVSGVQACKGLLYSLHQIHVYIGTQPNIVRQGTPKRSSLERVYYNANTHLQNLDESLFTMHAAAEEDDQVRDSAVRNTREAGLSCIVAYKQVLELISRGAGLYIEHTDPRFVRTFFHMLYASIVESINSAANLRAMMEEQIAQNGARQKTATTRTRVPKLTVRQTTPIKEKPRNISARLRSDTFNRPSSRMKSSSNPYSAVPLYLNSGRDRSNSRVVVGGPSSAGSSITGTPRSGESFFMPQSPGLPTPAQDYNPMSNADFNNQDLAFENVFHAFIRAVHPGMAALPTVQSAFRAQHQRSVEGKMPKLQSDVWSRLGYDASNCLEACQSLRARLAAVKLKDYEVRRSPEFWGYCTRYLNTFVRLMDDVKTARSKVSIEPQVLRTLKPVHLSVKAAVNTLQTSPWVGFLQASPSVSQSRAGSSAGSPAHSRATSKDTPPSVYQTYSSSGSGTDRMRATGLGVSNHGVSNGALGVRSRGDSEASLSPNMGMPQTPLSAALGPAVQATVPTSTQIGSNGSISETPPKTSFDTSFRGDIFERADTLLRSQSVIGHRR